MLNRQESEIKGKSKFIESLRNGWVIRYSETENKYWLCTNSSKQIVYKSDFGFEPGYMSSSCKHIRNYDLAKRKNSGSKQKKICRRAKKDFDFGFGLIPRNKHKVPKIDYHFDVNEPYQAKCFVKPYFVQIPYFNLLIDAMHGKFRKEFFYFIEEKNNNRSFGTKDDINHLRYSNKNDFSMLIFSNDGELVYSQNLFRKIFRYEVSIQPWNFHMNTDLYDARGMYESKNESYYIIDNKHLFDRSFKPIALDFRFIEYSYDGTLDCGLQKGDERDELFFKMIGEDMEKYISLKAENKHNYFFERRYNTWFDRLARQIGNTDKINNKIKIYLEELKKLNLR